MTYVTHADLGGLAVAGPIEMELEGEVFHAAWEARALALTVAMGATGSWNLDMMRSKRETLSNYRDLSYYEIWFNALINMLLARGLITEAELDKQNSIDSPQAVKRVLRAPDVAAALSRGAPTERPANVPARYGVGQRVRARSMPVQHHTRLPAYVAGKVGMVEQVRGFHVFADSNSQELGERPQWLYSVVFDALELWGNESAPGVTVSMDAFEAYLELV